MGIDRRCRCLLVLIIARFQQALLYFAIPLRKFQLIVDIGNRVQAIWNRLELGGLPDLQFQSPARWGSLASTSLSCSFLAHDEGIPSGDKTQTTAPIPGPLDSKANNPNQDPDAMRRTKR